MLIVSIDGGGIRGIIPAEILRRIEDANPGFLGSVDLFVGTSTGAILSAALADGMDPPDIIDLYKTSGPTIFAKRDWLDSVALGVDELFRADYSLEALEAALRRFFGDRQLSDLEAFVMLTTVQLHEVSPAKVKVFHNFSSPGNDRDVPIVDAVLGSAAAPVYFPAHRFGEWNLIDGGLALNNPAMSSIAQAMAEGHKLHEMRILSIGCGRRPLVIPGGDWGMKQWAEGLQLLSLMFDAQVETSNYMCRQVLGECFHRVDPVLPRDIGMDEVDSISDLLRVAQDANIDDTLNWVAIWNV